MSVAPTPLTVVVPTLDERGAIDGVLDAVAPLIEAGAEVVVSDGGSSDGTPERATARGHRVVRGARGRARQMNAGAVVADGALLAFLHADTQPGPGACARLLALARERRPLWGRFDVRLSGPGAAFRIIECAMNRRSRLTGVATGDQMMFVTRDLFDAVGGFPEIPLMEDVALSKRLRRLAAPTCPRERVETSSRRWRRDGVARTVALMWRLRLAYFLGADPARLAQRYHGHG